MTISNTHRFKRIMAGTAAVTAVAIAINAQQAQAQSLQPVVDVCTGISLEPSAVTDIIGAANDPLLTSLETLTDNLVDVEATLTGIPLLGLGGIFGPGDLLNVSDVDVEIDNILAGIAAGDPISLTVLDTNGNLIGPSDSCNLTTDGITLNTPQGITIGGNQITGLGDDGETGMATDIDSIAVGNRALTEVGVTSSIAIGTDATATASNSVALGTGSIADRGAVAGYSAPGLSGTYDSVGSVSVGSPGNYRQITNVAPGTDDNDAATVGQVVGAVAELADDAVLYDDASKTSVTLAGAGGTTIGNVADGTLDATSTEAVNGSQLYATNQAVTQNTTDITNIDARVATNETNISNIDGRVTQNEGDIADLQNLSVQYTDASQSDIVLGGAGGTTIANVADGEVSATSSEAVNGSQLFAVQTQVDQNTTDIANIDTRVSTNETNITNLDNRVTVNEGDIANLDTRVTVNEGDIVNLDNRVTVNEGDIANLDTRVTVNEGDIANLDNRVTVNEGDIANVDARVTVNEGDISDLDVRVTDNTTTINNIQAQVDNVPVGYVADSDPSMASSTPTQTVAMIGADASASVTLTNVAAGGLSSTSTDAVNGAQLYATNQQVAQNTTNIAQNRTDIDQNRTDIDQNTANIQNIQNNFSGSTVVAVQYSDPDNPNVSNGGTVTNDVALVGLDSSAPVGLHNVRAGVLPTDAVNVQQMQDGLSMVMDYADARFAQIGYDLNELSENANAGTANALAAAGLPQVIETDGRMMAGAIGHYRGETAFALGVSAAFNDGRGVAKFNGTVNTRGYAGISAGAGFAF